MAKSSLLSIIERGLGLSAVPSYGSVGREGWYPLVREPFAGAWQRNISLAPETVLTNPTAFRCITLLAGDVSKLRATLVARDGEVWSEVESPTYSPVLRKPNRYQTRQQFLEIWLQSKLTFGNTYVLKERDRRGVVVALYILDPARVRPLVSPDGSVFYQVSPDWLAGVETDLPAVPASEIIHDRENCLWHPLVGVSPLYAAGLSAAQGNEVVRSQALFFQNGAMPGGVLTTPDAIDDGTAGRYKASWEEKFTGRNVGRVAVLGNGLTYQPLTQKAVDNQLVEQLKASDEKICTAFGVPAFMVGVGTFPANVNVDALAQQYYGQRLQVLIEAVEACLDEGLGLPLNLGVQLDLEGLLRMDQATQAKALAELVKGSIMAPNEARAKVGLKPVAGGESPMAQQQDFSLAALAERDKDKPFAKPSTPPPAAPAQPANDADEKGWTERLRPVLEGFAAELAHRAEKRDAGLVKRLEAIEGANAATRGQVNQLVKGLPAMKTGASK